MVGVRLREAQRVLLVPCVRGLDDLVEAVGEKMA
jgi:hypothetical protein